MITPSTYAQFGDKKGDLKILREPIGWRKIEWDGSYLNTYVKYI